MVTKNEQLQNIIDGIKDKELKKLCNDQAYTRGIDYPPAFFYAREAALRVLFPTLYDQMLKVYEYNYSYIYNVGGFLCNYICLEYKIIDGERLESIKNLQKFSDYFFGDVKVIDSSLYLKGIEKGNFTAADVLRFTQENPETLEFFLPLLAGCGDKAVWEELCEKLKSAKLEDTLRVSLLFAMLNAGNAEALAYFIGEIEGNNFYRMKAMNELPAMMGEYDLHIPPKEIVAVLKDALADRQEKYLEKPFLPNYYFLKALKRLSSERYSGYIRRAMAQSNAAKWAVLYLLKGKELNGTFAEDIYRSELTMEDFSFFVTKIDCSVMERAPLEMLFDRAYSLLCGMDKVNYHYKTEEEIPFARDISKRELISLLAMAAVQLKQSEKVALLDGLYGGLNEEAQAEYLEKIGGLTKLNRRACIIRFLKTDNYWANHIYNERKIKLTYDEAVIVSDFLKSKKQTVKSKILKEFLASPDCDKIAEYLSAAKEDYKVAAGKELKESCGKADGAKLKESAKAHYYWEDKTFFTVEKPEEEIKNLASAAYPAFKHKGLSVARLQEFLKALTDFVEANKDYEFKPWYGEGLATFGSEFSALTNKSWQDIAFSDYPLGEQLKALFEKNLTAEERLCLLVLLYCAGGDAKKAYRSVYGKGLSSDADDVYDLMKGLREKSDFRGGSLYERLARLFHPIMGELLSDELLTDFALLFTNKEMMEKEKHKRGYEREEGIDVINRMSESTSAEMLKAAAHIQCVWLEEGLSCWLGFEFLAKALDAEIVSPSYVRFMMLDGQISFYGLTAVRSGLRLDNPNHPYPKFQALAREIVREGLEAELGRGSLTTPFSNAVKSMERICGAEYYVRAIAAMRGLTIVRSPYGLEKNAVLSHVMKCAVKAEGDSYEGFTALLAQYKITREELIRATLFNPSFIDYTERFLNIPCFKLAVYYFIAHLNESLYGEEQEKRAEAIKEFSDIDYLDFQDGAFDYNWYKEIVEKVPEKDLKCIYDNAKYVTVGGLHKRAQRFFDAMNGKISKEECLEKIKTTRNKDYCLIYSLVPVQGADDLRERYLLMQDFLKESKKYGAQRQASERRTVDIALENLARAAGYADTDIFIFEMEAEFATDIFKTYAVGDVEITPFIDKRNYKASYTVAKGGKTVASIPAKYKKDETVVWLKEQIKAINQKLKRVIRSFEEAMCGRVPFTPDQLKKLGGERTIAAVLESLLLTAGDKLALYRNGELTDLQGSAIQADRIFVAHPVELKRARLLPEAIRYVVQNNVKQPFKQALREIYTKSEEELSQEEVLRFKGFNVDLKKCIAALKGKGWGVSEDIGLRKVYYRTDTIAALFRKFDELYTFDYENVNRELHGLFFLHRKTDEVMPLKEVDEIVFSEALRDTDLMITISANGIYDFELAKSTVEIRKEILQSVAEILKLENVSFLKDNISVKGYYGTYLINIRTGLVFKEGKGNLLLDTVYSTEKPLLLDFIDEDPMAADVISKAVVLSGDKNIRDNAILREIMD